ncbi:MAG TPA: UvrD-helicase domain-containing protein [Nitrososphaerales archaeon]|nr:UvrD-helicase domain-containing protein [Nitrososphaerales archaeon]
MASGDWTALDVSPQKGGPLMSAESPGLLTIIFEVFDTQPRKTLCFYDVCLAGEANRVVEKILKVKSEAKRPLPRKVAAFSKIIPDWALLRPNGLEEIIRLEKASLLLTKEQNDILQLKPPLTIHGHAGSGKTLLICYSLAESIHDGASLRNRLAFLSYNSRLVEKARNDTGEILQGLYNSTLGLETVNFASLKEFLLAYVKNRERYSTQSYVTFSRFKSLYAKYSRGHVSLRKISAEKAWHGIRSILKGACLPPRAPPLSLHDYATLARRRRDFSVDEIGDINTIGKWYQEDAIKGMKLWDDQDLAWDALNSIINDKTFNPNFVQYDRIFCDEAQDLTQLEFRAIMELCKPPSGLVTGFQITLAGDPLQTINPTGFKWSMVRNEVYRVLRGSDVQFRELAENFRSDKRIVDFANKIQEVRGYYMGEDLAPQEGFVEDGETPQVVTLESGDEVEMLRNKMGELPPESAVIIWPEDEAEVTKLYEDAVLNKIDRDLELFTVSEAKGLEFRLVVLYKLGSSEDANRLRSYLTPKRTTQSAEPTIKDEIVLLYFLNRLYVALTRAKLYLIIIDTAAGIKNFWSIWRDALDLVPREEARTVIEGSPAFQGEFSQVKWRNWGETLLDHAEQTLDIRTFQRARRAFEKGGEESKVRFSTARIEELNGNLAEAGKIYFENHDYLRSADCFVRSEHWSEACNSLEYLPTTTEVSRRMAACKFKRDLPTNRNVASREFYSFFTHDKGVDRKYLEELGDILATVDPSLAVDVFDYLGREFNAKDRLIKAASIRYSQGEFAKSVDLYQRAGDTTSKGYNLGLAEKLNLEKDYAGCIDILHTIGENARVVTVYEKALEANWSPGEIRTIVADSYASIGRTDAASLILEQLCANFTSRHQWAKALGCLRPDLFQYDARIEICCRVLLAAAGVKDTISETDKEPLIIAARFVVADSYWDFRIKPEIMGMVYTQCGMPRERADFFRRFRDESWATEPYLHALDELLKYSREKNDFPRALEIETEIRAFKTDKGLAP